MEGYYPMYSSISGPGVLLQEGLNPGSALVDPKVRRKSSIPMILPLSDLCGIRASGHLTRTACFRPFRAVLRYFFCEIRGIAAQEAPGSAQNPSKTRSFMPNVNTPKGQIALRIWGKS
jgi:hypothetical protein